MPRRAHEKSFLVPNAAEKPANQKRRKVMMGKEQGDIEPGDKIEKEHARDKRVLGADKIKHEQTQSGHGLAQTQPMLLEQFVLQEIILRAAAGKRFQPDTEHDQAAVDAVAAPGE